MGERDQFSASLIERPELLSLVQIFAHRPQAWLAEAHWKTLATESGRPALSQIRKDGAPGRFHRRLSGVVAEFFDLEEVDYAEFSQATRRFALIAPGMLDRLAFATGLMRISPTLVSSIQRDRVASIVEQIGEDAYHTAVSRGPLTVGTDYEGVELSDTELKSDLKAVIERVGWRSLGEVLAGSPESILKRVFLKFSPAISTQIEAGLEVAGRETGLPDLMMRILKNHVNRRAAICVF